MLFNRFNFTESIMPQLLISKNLKGYYNMVPKQNDYVYYSLEMIIKINKDRNFVFSYLMLKSAN